VELTELELEQTLYQDTTAVVPMAGPAAEGAWRSCNDFRSGRIECSNRFPAWEMSHD
jgi:hypothetical protein